MATILPISEAREALPTIVKNVQNKLSEYVITVSGSPSAVLLSYDEYESWKETVEILTDASLLKTIQKGQEDIEKGDYVTLEQLEKDF